MCAGGPGSVQVVQETMGDSRQDTQVTLQGFDGQTVCQMTFANDWMPRTCFGGRRSAMAVCWPATWPQGSQDR